MHWIFRNVTKLSEIKRKITTHGIVHTGFRGMRAFMARKK